jgi:hypothetical protein
MAALAVRGLVAVQLVAVQLVAVHPVVTVAAVHRAAAALHPVVVHPVAGNDPLPQDGLASKTGIREATFIPSKSGFLVPMSQRCSSSPLLGKTTRVVSSLSGPSSGVRLPAPRSEPLEDVRNKTKFMRLLTIKI